MASCTRSRRPFPPSRRRPLLEILEERYLLSAGSSALVDYGAIVGGLPVASPLPSGPSQQSSGPAGYIPQQLQTAYGLSTGTAYNNNIAFAGIKGDGAGQTIGIFEEGYNPAFVSTSASNYSSSALAQFDQQFGLPDPPSLTFVDHNGVPLSSTNNSSNNSDFDDYGAGVEIALDIEWAHAMAPGANIVVLCATPNAANNYDDVVQGMATLAGLPGVSVVSVSYGLYLDYYGEESLEQSWDSTILEPAIAAHPNVSFFAASGDNGAYYGLIYPSASPNVVSVGGTSLSLTNSGQWAGEVGWDGSGGGYSSAFALPSYQQNDSFSGNNGQRTNSDVAADADPNTGVAVYDPYDYSTATPWVQVGGTSLATPLWAGMAAIADQGRVLAGGQPLGATQMLTDLYSLDQLEPGDFHDVTQGNNGYSAGPGYDLVTGLGTPQANLLIPNLSTDGVVKTADLAVTASGPSWVSAGSNATYTITLTNNGPDAAKAAVLSDTLPAGSTLVSMNQTAGSDAFTFAQSASTITETAGGDLASGSSDTFTLVVSAPGTLTIGSDFSDTASVTSSTLDPKPANNTATVSGTVVAPGSADMAVTNSGPASVTQGTNATYTITLVNNGPNAAGGVVLTDTLPSGSTVVSMTQTAGTDAFNFAQSGGVITESATADVASGSSDTFTLVVFAPASLAAGADFSDTASVTSSAPDPDTTNNTATVSGTVVAPAADMAVTNSGPSSVTAGTNATYTITVVNNGPNPAQNVVLTDTLPSGSALVSMNQTAGSDTFSFAQSGGTVTESADDTIASGSSDTFVLIVSAPLSLPAGSNFSDTASVTSSNVDPDPANNTATVVGTIVEPQEADLAVTNSGPSSVTQGTNATYTIKLVNNGPDTAQNVVLSDILPTGSTLVSMSHTAGYDAFAFAQSGGTVTESAYSGIASGSSDTFVLVVAAPTSLPTGANFSDTASVTSSTLDPNPANNTATVTGTVVAASADLAVTNSGPSSVTQGTNATYTIKLVNNGPNTAQNVVLSDILPTGSTLVSMSHTAGYDAFAFAQSGGTVTESAYYGIASGSSDTFVLVVAAPTSLLAGANFSDTALVTSSTADPNLANNTATVTGTVVAASADLAVTNSGPSSVTQGTNATYTITLVNHGPNPAQNVVLSDILPTGSTLVSMSHTAGYDAFAFAQSGGTVTESAYYGIASGSSDTFVLVVAAPTSLPAGANFSDTASVTSSTADPNLANNTATVAGTVVAASADLAVTNTGPSSVTQGTHATYTITMVNHGPNTAQNVVLSDILPTGSTLVSMSHTAGYDAFAFAQPGGTVTESAYYGIASGSSDTFVLVVAAPTSLPAGANFSDTASVTSSTADPNLANNTATVAGTVVAASADLAVTNTGPSSVTQGTNATYTITLVNHGPNPAQNVVLSDILPTGSTLVSMSHTAGYDAFAFAQSGGMVTESAYYGIASGSSDTFVLVVAAPTSLPAGANFSDTASVTSSTADPNAANNTATVAGTVVAASADLAVTNSGPSSVTQGTNATYTITLVNHGPNPAQNVVLSDILPTGSTLVSMSHTSGYDAFAFAQSGGTVTESAYYGIASGSSDTFVLVVAAPTSLPAGANFSDTASVTSSTADPNAANNTATVAGTIAASSAAALSSSTASPSAGTNSAVVSGSMATPPKDDSQAALIDQIAEELAHAIHGRTGDR
jgi:large repetitive protein